VFIKIHCSEFEISTDWGDFALAKYAKSIIFETKHFVYLLPRIMQSAVNSDLQVPLIEVCSCEGRSRDTYRVTQLTWHHSSVAVFMLALARGSLTANCHKFSSSAALQL
jgi:kynureninase